MGMAPQWIERPEKLLVFILALVAKKEGSPELMVISLSNQKSKLIRDS